MTPPDSGEREVRDILGRREYEKLASVSVPLPLAQRILAALENPESPGEVADVVAELRAAVERKT